MKKSLFALAFIACFAFGAPDLATAEKECDGGNMKSCAEAGLQCKDEVKKLKLFEKACDGGDGVACGMLADMYGNGDGVAMDKTKAAVYYKKRLRHSGRPYRVASILRHLTTMLTIKAKPRSTLKKLAI